MRLRGIGKMVGWVAGIVGVLVMLMVGGIAGLARTPFGGERIRRVVESRVNHRIRGTLHVGRVALGRSDITLDGVELKDPQGSPVATIERIYLRVSLAALFHHELFVPSLDVQGPHLAFAANAAGQSNWSQALASRHRQAPTSTARGEPTKSSDWSVVLGAFQLTDGSLEVKRSGAPTIVMFGLHGTSNGEYSGRKATSFRVRAELAGDLRQPVQKPLTLTLDTSGTLTEAGLKCAAMLGLGVGRSGVRLAISTDSLDLSQPPSGWRGRAVLTVAGAVVTPSELAELLPALRPKADLHLAGRAEWNGQVGLLSAELRAHARATRAAIELSSEARPSAAVVLGVKVEHIDLSDWLADGPNSDFGLDVHGQGRAKASSLAASVGTLEARIPRGRVGGYALGPVRLSLQAKAGDYRLAELDAQLPGARVHGRGGLSSGQVSLRLHVAVDSLAKLARVFAPSRGEAARSVSGRGSLQVNARGNLRAPSLRLSAAFGNLRFQDNSAATVRLHAFVPNLRQPWSANVDLTIPDMRAGSRWLRGLALQWRGVGARLSATLAMDAPERVRVLGEGSWRDRHEAVELTRLDVASKGTGWSLARTARVAWSGRTIRITSLDLRARAGDGSLQLDTQLGHRRVLADVRLHGVRLEQLPQGLLPARLGLGGQVDAEIHARGTWRVPELHATIAVQQSQLGGCALGDVSLSADGQAGHASTVTARILPPRDAGSRRCVEAADVLVRTQLPSDGVWSRHLMTSPSHVEVHLHGIDIGFLARLLSKPHAYGGHVDVDATSAGSLKAPVVTAALRATGIYTVGVPPTDGTASLMLAERDLSGHLQIDRKRVPLLTADFGAKAPLSPFQASAIGAIPLRLHAVLGSVYFQHASLSMVSAANDSDSIRGKATAVLDVGGTLSDPHATLHANVDDVRLGNTRWGDAQADATYARGEVAATISAHGHNEGALSFRTSMKVALNYPQFVRPIAWANHSIAGQIDASSVDLSLLSAISPRWHDISGKLACHLTWSGTVADPMPAGRLELQDGAVTITDVGRYKNVHLSLQGDRQHLVLDPLRLASGDGSATVAAEATHRSARTYDVTANLHVDKFPVYSDGQAIASVSSKATAKAVLSIGRFNATVTVESARATMNDGKRKEITQASRTKDVVVVRDAQPVPAQAGPGKALGGSPTTIPPVPPPSPSLIFVNAPRNLWVSGKDAAVEIGLEPGFRIELSQPVRIYGGVVVKRGRLDVLGKRFDLKAESRLRFQGLPDAPDLDITAQYVNEQEHVTVVATVKGVPKHLVTTLTTPDRPDLTESQLYTLLLTGRLSFAQGPASSASPANQAGTFLGGLMASQLQKIVAKKLPFDVLTIEGGDTMGSAKVEAGKYVTSDIYVGYVGRLGADPTLLQNRNAVHLEYMLGAHWSFEGEYGDAKAGSGDIDWTKHY